MSLAEELRTVPEFADLPAEGLEWLASQMTRTELEPGEVFFLSGAPADRMIVVLEGELRAQPSNPEMPIFVVRAPAVTGMLPYSRMTHFPSTVRAVIRARAATFPADRFQEMLDRLPMLQQRLISVLTDRVRLTTQIQLQTEKLAALGKISAGLAHELNNPAAAAQRAVDNLRQAFQTFRDAAARLNSHELSLDQRQAIPALESELGGKRTAVHLDSLERSDCEEQVAGGLERHGVEGAWEFAPVLVGAGCDVSWLEGVARQFPPEVLPDLLARVAASLAIGSLLEEIEHSSTRITELVRAIKEYTYMDQGPEQEVDIHHGLENTLIMLRHRLKHGVQVKLDFDRTLPRVCAHGSELNQVWTNLIDNAVDAMDGKGELRIRTARELDYVLVEIVDNGPGIPPKILDHIFEPFFTTKGVGHGTGLGLETVRRIVREHGGEITVESAPGATRFEVRIPLHAESERRKSAS
jgi:signal transduction histidine kinase